MTYERIIENYDEIYDPYKKASRKYLTANDIGVWEGDKWIENFVTIAKTVEDFKVWVKKKGYENKEFHFVGDYL